jgi:hypothetical protein
VLSLFVILIALFLVSIALVAMDHHVAAVEKAGRLLKIYMRKVNAKRWADDREEMVAASLIFVNNEESAKEFLQAIRPRKVKAWLSSKCEIRIRETQSSGMRTEFIINKRSEIQDVDVRAYFTGTHQESTASPSTQHTAPPPTQPTAPPPTQPTAPLPTQPTAPLPTQSTQPTQPTAPPPTQPTQPTASVPVRGKLLAKAKGSLFEQSARQQQRVLKAAAPALKAAVESMICVDNGNVSYDDVVQLAASKKTQTKAMDKKSLADSGIVQAQVQLYLHVPAGKAKKREKKRILSTISREFTLEELNEVVFRGRAKVSI